MLNIAKFIKTAINKEHDRLILWLPVLFGLGIGVYFILPFEPNLWYLSACCAVFLLLVVLSVLYKKYALRLLAIALLVVALGGLRAETRTISVAAPIVQKTLYFRNIEGKIADIQVREKGEKIYLSEPVIEWLTPEETPKMVSITLKNVTKDITIGDKVQLLAMLFPPPAPAMPRSYDFARMFYYQQLGAVGFSPKPPVKITDTSLRGEAEAIQKQQGSWIATPLSVARNDKFPSFDQWLNALRLSITERILAPMTKADGSAENGWIAAAMMVGEQSGVSKEVADVMRESGIYHILSISGLHMSLAVMIMFVSVRFLLTLFPPLAMRLPVKKIAAAVGILSSFFYLLLAGYPVPAVRSFIMVACVMLAILVDRVGISIFALAWAALLTLIWQPESLLGASFQLSFAATVAIVTFFERYSHLLHKPDAGFAHKIWLYFWGIILTSLVVTIATTPLVVYHFNRFTIWGIAANMLILPLASAWIMPAAVLALLLMPFGLEHYPLVVLDYGLSLMMYGARIFAALPYANVPLPSPSFWGICLVVFGGLWLVIWQQKWRFMGIAAAIIGMATVLLHQPYDLLISGDASKVAVRLENSDKLLFLRGKDSSFDGQMWLRNDGQDAGVTVDDMDEGISDCDKQKCWIAAYGKKIVAVKGSKKENIDGSVCDEIAGWGRPDIVISAVYLDRKPECANVPLLFDKGFLRYNGATAVRFDKDGNAQIETARQFRGDRPWVVR